MEIRPANENDNAALQVLQAKCPQGTTLIVAAVNTPDFFARVKAYKPTFPISNWAHRHLAMVK